MCIKGKWQDKIVFFGDKKITGDFFLFISFWFTFILSYAIYNIFFKELQIFYKVSNCYYSVSTMCYVPYYIILVIPNDNPERKTMNRLERKGGHLLQVLYLVRRRAGMWALLDLTPILVSIHCPILPLFIVIWHNLLKDFANCLTTLKAFLLLILCYNLLIISINIKQLLYAIDCSGFRINKGKHNGQGPYSHAILVERR